MRIEVRCCCQPQKLLGWIDAPREGLRDGDRVKFVVQPAGWQLASLDADPVRIAADIIELPVATISTPDNWRGHLALKSEETPIERLRLIHGFEENTR